MIEARPTPPSTSSSALPDASEDAALCRARAELYAFLGAGALAPPTGAQLEVLADPAHRSVLAECLGEAALAAPLELPTGDRSEVLAKLSDEFHALFVVPNPRYCSPNESVLLGGEGDDRRGPGLLCGPQARQVWAAYAAAGHVLEPGFAGLPDHVGAELLFMSRLCEDQAQALDRAELHRAAAIGATQGAFLADHLRPFALRLAALIEERSTHAYFRTWAALLRALVRAEAGFGAMAPGAT